MTAERMDRWGVCHQAMFICKHKEYGSRLTSSASEEEEPQDEEKHIKPKPIFMPKFKKRKRLSRNRLREIKAGLCESQSGSKLKSNKQESRDKWSDERYKLSEQNLWEVLKDEGATSGNPITQPSLRMATRKHIGDTGLLDHLLKHIDGKVAPGGTELFRRRFNTSGIMEYWLESANLDKVRQEAGVNDPYWILPSTFRADNVPSQNADTIGELEILKIEMAQMKKDMEHLIAKQQEKGEISLMEQRNEALMKWKAMTEQHLTEIMTSLNGVQGMYDNMFIWKTKVEQQLILITNKLSDLQASKERTTFSSPAVRWQDWLENSNLDRIQGNEFAPWFGNPELLNVSQEILLQDPYLTLPIVPVGEELTNMKSDLLELGPTKQEDQPNVTPDSCHTVNSKSDLDNSLILFQEMFMELFTWKGKMEQQLLEVSNTVFGESFCDVVGSPYYVAPEVLCKLYGPESDVWSAGVILYILLSGVPPFWAETEPGIFRQILMGKLDFQSQPWPSISDSAKDLIRKMLDQNPRTRLTAHEVLSHPWIVDDNIAPDKPLDSAVLSRLKQFSVMNKLKKMALRVIAERLSEEEIGGLKELFRMIDTDNSGTITFDELKDGLKRVGSELMESEIKDLMNAADIDNSGTIDYGEFIAATVHLNKLEREENLLSAFSYFDKDGSGYITLDEIQQACKDFGLDDIHIDDMIKEIDQDNDGQIDYGEFAAMMRKGNGGIGRRTMRKTLNFREALGLLGTGSNQVIDALL